MRSASLQGECSRDTLGYCYWQWAWLARAQGDKRIEKQKLKEAIALFAGLKMSRERDAVQTELDKLGA
jgi:hypothetical protein